MRRAVAVMFAGGCVMGCHHDESPRSSSATQPVFLSAAAQGEIAAKAPSEPVQEGVPPLAYRVESAGSVRIVDQTTEQPVAMAELKAGDFVAVTQDNGILLGGEKAVKGPLPDGHRYSIYIDHPTSNTYRSGVIVPDSR